MSLFCLKRILEPFRKPFKQPLIKKMSQTSQVINLKIKGEWCFISQDIGLIIPKPLSQYSFQKQTINVKGQKINYIKTGNGKQTLLCCPGALGTIWSDFKPQITDLDKSKFTIVAWDPPGYGFSRPQKETFLSNSTKMMLTQLTIL